jgi:hypothetical protein
VLYKLNPPIGEGMHDLKLTLAFSVRSLTRALRRHNGAAAMSGSWATADYLIRVSLKTFCCHQSSPIIDR